MSRLGPRLKYSQDVGVNGKRLCAWCQKKEIGKGRRKYCSKKCAEAYAISRNAGYARLKVWERDQGVCALCEFDAKLFVERVYKKLHTLLPRQAEAFNESVVEMLRQQGFHRAGKSYFGTFIITITNDQLFDVDHILPVAEGGGGAQLDNLRTLCCPCHKQVTKELRQRLSRRGKKEQQTKLFLALSQKNAPVQDQLEKLLEKDELNAEA